MKIHIFSAFVVGLVASLAALAADIEVAGDSAANRVAIGTCAGCHGPHGLSDVPRFPKLAGQPANYISAQLKAFRDHTRKDPDAQSFMWGIAASLDEKQIDAVARYYAAQPPQSHSSSASAEAVRGKTIYEKGIESQQVPACAGCHGLKAEGLADIPRLAGQHSPYFLDQMRSYKGSARSSDLMQPIASRLDARNLEDLAAYVHSR